MTPMDRFLLIYMKILKFSYINHTTNLPKHDEIRGLMKEAADIDVQIERFFKLGMELQADHRDPDYVKIKLEMKFYQLMAAGLLTEDTAQMLCVLKNTWASSAQCGIFDLYAHVCMEECTRGVPSFTEAPRQVIYEEMLAAGMYFK